MKEAIAILTTAAGVLENKMKESLKRSSEKSLSDTASSLHPTDTASGKVIVSRSPSSHVVLSMKLPRSQAEMDAAELEKNSKTSHWGPDSSKPRSLLVVGLVFVILARRRFR